ncbi:hypothetical protein SMD22_01200 (plasmid) [Brevibacillus halotolerans]|nr:hypothetical protein SMD22_01200 [Brevibacillus halotolerans]
MIQNEVVFKAKFQKDKCVLIIKEIITGNSKRSKLKKFLVTIREIEGNKEIGRGVSYMHDRTILDIKGIKRSEMQWVENSLQMVISNISG